jgi:hypothetical protein
LEYAGAANPCHELPKQGAGIISIPFGRHGSVALTKRSKRFDAA